MTTEDELEQMLEIEVRQYNESADSIQKIVRRWQEIEHWMTSGAGTPTILQCHTVLWNEGPKQGEPERKEHKPGPGSGH